LHETEGKKRIRRRRHPIAGHKAAGLALRSGENFEGELAQTLRRASTNFPVDL
jgi:hypothetical protein